MSETLTIEKLDSLRQLTIEALSTFATRDMGWPEEELDLSEMEQVFSLAKQGLNSRWRTDLENAPDDSTLIDIRIEKKPVAPGYEPERRYTQIEGCELVCFNHVKVSHWRKFTPPEGA